MLIRRPARERGHFNHGWLDTWHSFSFGNYRDPAHDQFRALRVLNDDRVQPGQGFGTHGHQDMEILTWVLSGMLNHEDSSGNKGTLVPGDAQRMSAGTGIRHSEFNGSGVEEVHFLQIWLLPDRQGLAPGYAQKHFSRADRQDRFALIASPGGRNGSLTWNQDAELRAALLAEGTRLAYPLPAGRAAWVQVAGGAVQVNGMRLEAGDGAGVTDEAELAIQALTASEVLLFDLA